MTERPLSSERPWYEDAFRECYRRVYPHRDLPSARREIGELLERGSGTSAGIRGRVLDLGCGFGRHALALRERELDVFGLDLSAELLRASREPDPEGRLRGRLVQGDFLALPFADASFDAVLMLFSSFGYLDEAGNRRVLDELARVLRPGGTLLLDLMNPELVRATLVPHSRTERDGLVIDETRSLTEWGRRVVKHVRLSEPGDGGPERAWHEDVRMYGPGELRALMDPRGLALERVEGDFDGSPFGREAQRQLVWAARRPAAGT